MKLQVLSVLVLASIGSSVLADSTFCPGQCEQVWEMQNQSVEYDNHGKGYIHPDKSRDIKWNNDQITLNYQHTQGQNYENTTYVKFVNLPWSDKAFKQHGYITGTITVNAPQNTQNVIWPAFWLTASPWPYYGEIDTAEYMADFTTNTNLNGSVKGTSHANTIVHYGQLGLADVGKTHQYGIEWQQMENGKYYILTTYFDNHRIGSYSLKPGDDLDQSVINGMNTGKMKLVFDTDNIGALRGYLANTPTFSYSLTASNVAAYKITGSGGGGSCPTPTNVTGKYNGNNTVTINWNKPSDKGSNQITGYELYDYHQTNPKGLQYVSGDGSTAINNEPVGNPGPDGTYVFQVGSSCNQGEKSSLAAVTIQK